MKDLKEKMNQVGAGVFWGTLVGHKVGARGLGEPL